MRVKDLVALQVAKKRAAAGAKGGSAAASQAEVKQLREQAKLDFERIAHLAQQNDELLVGLLQTLSRSLGCS